jgi:omega-6 fatty acid desaturase (delta-12 desaturase)
MKSTSNEPNAAQKTWRQIVNAYQEPDLMRSIWQLVNTLVLYALLWGLMAWSLDISYWLTLAMALPAGGMVVRLFIIFHDCGHGAFFKSAKANHRVGSVVGVLVFTPYFYWRQAHAIHHATAGNLDKRGTGDVWTMTVEEYLAASPWKRFTYRVYRNPFLMFGFGPLIMFLITHRLVMHKDYKKREKNSVHWTNLALLVYILLLSWLVGFKEFWLIQLPVIWVASTVGTWMFYIQHQFEDVYWARAKDWDFVKAGLEGSSFYELPKVLQWFTGNIGFHHIHHLSPRIPNYLLEKCHRENRIFQVKPVRLFASLKSLTFRLWDEKKRQLVDFRYLKTYQEDIPGL